MHQVHQHFLEIADEIDHCAITALIVARVVGMPSPSKIYAVDRQDSSQRSSRRSSKLARQASLQRYASARKFGRRHELERERRNSAGVVEFSRRNPNEEDTVMEAQWRLQQAMGREKGLGRRLVALVNRVLGFISSAEEPTVVLDHVLLGSDDNAASREVLFGAGVTHVCNCAAQAACHFEGEFVYMKLHIRDADDEELTPLYRPVADFLKRVEVLRGRVLIHCIAGLFGVLVSLLGCQGQWFHPRLLS